MPLLSRPAGRLVCACLLLVRISLGQDSRGTIAGRVIDAHDAGIPGARVAITNIETGVAIRLTSNDKGSYAAPLLIPGKYAIAAERDGFKRAAGTTSSSA